MEVVITDLDHQGRGIARINNKIIFIPNTILRETVKIKITKEKKNFMEGKVIEFIQKDINRIEDICKYYPKCGGCQLLHMPYREQLLYKENKVKNIFKRYGLEDIKINEIVGSPSKLNYRNKVNFHIHNNEVGFYEESSKRFIKIDKCLLLNDKLNEVITSIPKNNTHITVRSNGYDVIYEQDKKIMHTIVDYKFLVSRDAFFQINDFVTPLLYNKIKEYLDTDKNDTVLDLYCGTGTISIFIHKEVKKVIGIEINESAIKDALENAKINGADNVEFICGDAGLEAKRLHIKPDSIIVDPPRAGLNKEAITTILDFSPKALIYVSCDPMTLVRDLNILKDYYEIVEVTPFDMFPNTYHVECCTQLKLKDEISNDNI